MQVGGSTPRIVCHHPVYHKKSKYRRVVYEILNLAIVPHDSWGYGYIISRAGCTRVAFEAGTRFDRLHPPAKIVNFITGSA